MTGIRLCDRHLAELDRQALEAYPEECCGILAGLQDTVTEIRPTPNSHPGARNRRYRIAPDQLLAALREAQAAGRQVLGFYHSHPDRPAIPSRLDRHSAAVGLSYLILAVDARRVQERRSWRLGEGRDRFEEEPIVSWREP